LDEEQLAKRFSKLWTDCANTAVDPEPVWQMLKQHYREPHRFYHNLGHLDHCLRELDAAKDHIEEFHATEMAIWFHDIIYIYGANDNEARSAETFEELAGPIMAKDFVDRVCQFIIATQHAGAAADEGIAFLVDIDLSGFGLPWDGYLADSDALRDEAPKVSDKSYYQGKLRFLDELQRWQSLFQTDYFRNRLESNAQANISRYAGELREQGFGD